MSISFLGDLGAFGGPPTRFAMKWISDSKKIISTNTEPGVVAKTATGGNGGKKILDDGFWMLDWGEESLDGGFWVNFRQEDRICRKGDCGEAAVAGGANFGF